jgi:hypothetical protein
MVQNKTAAHNPGTVRESAMAITLNPEMVQGPGADGMWRFEGTQTDDTDVIETFNQTLSHNRVVQIFEAVVGAIPATGFGREDVVEHWNALEPHLTAEIEQLLD